VFVYVVFMVCVPYKTRVPGFFGACAGLPNQHVHDPNGIIDASSATQSPRAPDSMAAAAEDLHSWACGKRSLAPEPTCATRFQPRSFRMDVLGLECD